MDEEGAVMLTIKEVEHVALLARLELSEEEKKLYQEQLSAILDYAKKLDNLDTTNVAPMAHVLPLHNVFRADVVGEHMDPEDVLANAPEKSGHFFKVPKIV